MIITELETSMPLLEYLCTLFLIYMTYSFIGWAYESFVWAIFEKRRFINRGFLLGPFCPIYGLVCIMDWFLLRDITGNFRIFFVAMLVCCFIEYMVSAILEKLFHARWWDYSNYAFNLNGRISLYSGIFFGFAGLFLVKVLHPFLWNLYSTIPSEYRILIAAGIFILLLSDIVFTIIVLNNFNNTLKKLHEALTEKLDKPFEYLNSQKGDYKDAIIVRSGRSLILRFEKFNKKLSAFELRFLTAFPDYKSFQYNGTVEKIQEFLHIDRSKLKSKEKQKKSTKNDNK